MNLFSTISILPTPFLLAIPLAVMNKVTGSVTSFPSDKMSFLGIPFSNSTTKSSGSSGASIGSTVNFHISLGGVVFGSSRIPASNEIWAMFSSVDQGLALV
ncbi:hypothetical protein OGATHE_002140 [Ogataea polymorpha]|uniref:Uncharacterized protein n=1 Tax=Ogataea polymorpha TaxID=460523 RepID=A0A9P8PME4_9ASCO|nr:hypothetical protein OGATHE_002140 [Ogataea polymorpha]